MLGVMIKDFYETFCIKKRLFCKINLFFDKILLNSQKVIKSTLISRKTSKYKQYKNLIKI